MLDLKSSSYTFLQVYFVGDEFNDKDIRYSNFRGVKYDVVSQLQKNCGMNAVRSDWSCSKNRKDFQVVINAVRKPSWLGSPLGTNERWVMLAIGVIIASTQNI